MVFVPFDATDDEISALSVIREAIPPEMEVSLRAWMMSRLLSRSMVVMNTDFADIKLVHELQAALRLNLGAPASGYLELDRAIGAVYAKGVQVVMRVTDFLLSRIDPAIEVEAITSLSRTLDWAHCKYKVDWSGQRARLSVRLPDGMEEVAQTAIDSAQDAGPLLYKAWQYAFGLEPQPAEAMDFAVKAVERVVTPIVCPNHPSPSLGNAISDVRQQGNWTHNLRTDGDKAPANTTIHHMLQTLWAGQHYRHVDQNAVTPTLEQAQAHVQLAALLVGWFSSGSITRGQSVTAG
ncbi:hypothetical protein NG702_20445 [Pseudarthrobacter sp. MDT3-28]|uniref:hypothetical protein n=1 Tax=Pseudarthrobacter raffinosi TaxID=2953651 RepID=UPI00208EFA31|nr:hypothetical protein [Pseudarthrobacter sp. MDT3-28]MCO4239737.1 hypothetical protein [Pseudarthrobacter sp. MDT3-28]